MGDILCPICPRFKRNDWGRFTWLPAGSYSTDSSNRKSLSSSSASADDLDANDDMVDAPSAAEPTESEDLALREAKAKGEKIMKQLRDKKIKIPVSTKKSYLCNDS